MIREKGVVRAGGMVVELSDFGADDGYMSDIMVVM